MKVEARLCSKERNHPTFHLESEFLTLKKKPGSLKLVMVETFK